VSPPPLRMETDPVSKTLCSLVFRLLDNGQFKKNRIILNVISHCQNHLESNLRMVINLKLSWCQMRMVICLYISKLRICGQFIFSVTECK
jgi:hypothetical protein